MTTHQFKLPQWALILGLLALFWNIFGAIQFIQSVTATKDHLIEMGMTELQATTMLGYPLWMTLAFAIGTLGGCLGSILFLLKKPSKIIFQVSLVGYIILYIGDITEGIFKVMGMSQVIILTTVVLIAAGLVWLSSKFESQIKK